MQAKKLLVQWITVMLVWRNVALLENQMLKCIVLRVDGSCAETEITVTITCDLIAAHFIAVEEVVPPDMLARQVVLMPK